MNGKVSVIYVQTAVLIASLWGAFMTLLCVVCDLIH